MAGDMNNCTSDWDLAMKFPNQYEYCHQWAVPLMLAIFMLITNILLLNLLIAIFRYVKRRRTEQISLIILVERVMGRFYSLNCVISFHISVHRLNRSIRKLKSFGSITCTI